MYHFNGRRIMETKSRLTTLQVHHLAQRMPYRQTAIRAEMRAIREHLRMADADMKLHNWDSVAELMNEIVAMATELTTRAQLNVESRKTGAL